MAAAAARGGLCRAKLARLVPGCRTASTGSPAAPTPDGPRLQEQQQGKLTRVWQSEGIRNIVLSNPGKRNALSLSMLKSLRHDILHNIDSTDLRVIIISAEGPVFSSGHDLKELTKKEGTEQHMDLFKTCSEVMTLLPKLPVPVIAKVNGLATAAGCQLVASCDIAVASEKSRFATPGVNVGLFCSTPAVAIGRSLPKKVALEILFTGDPMTAQDALRHGLISRVVPEDQLESETLSVAQKICQSSRAVLALGKATFYKQMEHDIGTAYQIASQVMVENLALKDGQEGIEAFISNASPTGSILEITYFQGTSLGQRFSILVT